MLDKTQLVQKIEQGLKALGLTSEPDLAIKLTHLLELLCKWNGVYNLTAIRDPNEMVTHHVLDSLSIAPYIQGQRITDVGTGAGFPGLPLALLYPEYAFHLLDSNGKKTRFLTQAVAELALSNVTVQHIRVEQLDVDSPFDCIVSRAFSQIDDFLAKTHHLAGTNSVFLAMKGQYPDAELANLSPNYQLAEVQSLSVPGLKAERHLIAIVEAASGSCYDA